MTVRQQIALWSAAVTGFSLITFGTVAALNLRQERAESHRHAAIEDSETGDDPLQELLGAYLLAAPAVVIVVAAGSWWIARRAMQPVAQITSAAQAITADRLEARLPVPSARDEIGLHVRALNEMFDRLQRSFEQATRFTADASHELRTPLTILRGEIEEALRSGHFDSRQEPLLVGLLDQVGQLQKIADNLLLLSHFDIGRPALRRSETDYTALAEETVEDAELLAMPKRINVSKAIAPGVRIDADPVLLRRVLLNLVDNAVRYNRANGSVDIRLEADEGRAILRIANTGPAIPSEWHADLFQRFFRRDRNAGAESGGSGLGLSLCREIVAAHAGKIELERSVDDRTEFRVELPLQT